MIYVPNVGEKEMIKDILAAGAITLGLYSNQVQGDGALIIDSLTEFLATGGRGYARIELDNPVLEGSAAADKWSVSTDANGKAAAAYDNVAQQWTFNAVDVADGLTAYGVFGFRWVLPFDGGTKEIKVGDIVKGAAGATGIVTSVLIFSGSWGAGTAAGELRIKTKTGTFVDNEVITISGAIATAAINAAGTGHVVGDVLSVLATGASGAKIVVTGVDAYGGITTFVVVEGGQGYTVSTGHATVALTGSGNDDATIDISTLATTTYAIANTGTTNSGDAHKRLMFVDPFATAQLITPAGFAIQYPAALTLASAA
jgi:hypothetical protein